MVKKLVLVGVALFLAGCGSRAVRPRSSAEAPSSPAASLERSRPAMRAARIGTPGREADDLAALDVVLGEHPEDPRYVTSGDARLSPATDAAALGPPVLFGLMHAHTFMSDGSGTPKQAFAQAKTAGLDFFAVTPHNHDAAEQGAKEGRKDGVMIAKEPKLYKSTSPVTVTRKFRENGQNHQVDVTTPSLRSAASAATTNDFVALFGQEFSTISSGNHANVLQPLDVIDDIPNGNYRPLYEQFGTGAHVSSTVIQFNHPDIHNDLFYGGSDQKRIDQMFNDYGLDEYGEDFSRLVAAARPVVALVEVLSGPALDPDEHPTFHYSGSQLHENDYYFYLVQGFHVSPSVGQDNHFETWGTATPARMGVYATAKTTNAIIGAMRDNQTYATEDTDLVIDFTCNGKSMGSTIELATGAAIKCEASVSDGSDSNGHVSVDLFYGDIQPARDRGSLVEWQPNDGKVETLAFDSPATLAFEEYQASGKPEFFYVRVKQADGDRAWSAPVWFNHPRNR